MSHNEAALPLDIIHLISNELAARNDFDTLFNCVISSRCIAAAGAVNALYRISHECFTSASRSRDIPEEAALASQILQKTTILWRSIVLSALDKAMFPYCQYLRVLDLRDLGGLLDDGHFSTTKLAQYFFKGPMSQFQIRHGTGNAQGRAQRGLNVAEIVLRISNVVLLRAPLIESLSEPSNAALFARMLPTYTERLSHLRQLDLASGDVLTDPAVRADLRKNCPNLQAFRILSYMHEQADANLADFLNGLKAGNLVHFENFSLCGIKDETCAALSRHGKSVRQLKLMLDEDGFKGLPKLVDCTGLETLSLQGTLLPPSLDTLLGEDLMLTVTWLKQCDRLNDVSIKNLPFAPDLVTPILEAHDDLIESLRIEADDRSLFPIEAHMGLASALATQCRLQLLSLEALGDNAAQPQRLAWLRGICDIKKLVHLDLRQLLDRMYEDGSSYMLNLIFTELPQLELLYFTGPVLEEDANQIVLSNTVLKTLTLAGMSDLSFTALSSLVDTLSTSNAGFSLSIEYADPESALSPSEQTTIRERLAAEIGGTFSYALVRDEADVYSESDFSD